MSASKNWSTSCSARQGNEAEYRFATGHGIVELEGEVTRNTEAIRDPLLCQPPYDVIRDRRLLAHGFFS
jgi:hypothetical protein